MLIFNMCLGNITPPVGSVLFVGCGIENVSIEKVTPKLIILFYWFNYITYAYYIYSRAVTWSTKAYGIDLV